MSQLFNLFENDKEEMGNFIAHDLSIHKQYYKLPDETLKISPVSKILLAMESGHLHEIRQNFRKTTCYQKMMKLLIMKMKQRK